jgi:presqualene diphosphate synthase
MSTIEHSYAPISQPPRQDAAINGLGDGDNPVTWRPRATERSFSWAVRLLPAQRRKAAYAVYNFYREIHEIADGGGSQSLKQILLVNWRSEIARLYGGRPQHAVTQGLSKCIHDYNLRCQDFLAVIEAGEIKLGTVIRAPSFAQLDRYCAGAATAPMQLLLSIFGDDTPTGARAAEQLGRAVHFTNILHDLAADAKRHRLFLPRELLTAHGIFATMPSWVLAHPSLPEVCRDFALRTQCHYAAATEALATCPPSAIRPAAVMLGVHRALLDVLLVRGWRRLDEPVEVPLMRELALVLRHGLTGH